MPHVPGHNPNQVTPQNLFNFDPMAGTFSGGGNNDLIDFSQYGFGGPGGGAGGYDMANLSMGGGGAGGTPSASTWGANPGNWLQQLGGASPIGPGGATGMQSFAGGVDKFGNQFKGWGSSALGLGTSLASGYFNFQNMKRADEALDFQKESWKKNFAAQKHSFNENAASINAAREARAPGAGHRIKEL